MGIPIKGRNPGGTWDFKNGCLCAILVLLTACTGSSSKNDFPKSEGLILSGSVGDGPIVGATILITDAEDELVLEGTSDLTASYNIEVPDGTQLPVWLRVSGGTDLVTGRAADFELLAVAFSSGPLTLNASPYTTLAVRTAQCLSEMTPVTLGQSWSIINKALNLGWDSGAISDPMSEAIDAENVATVLLGNEALGEVVRRTVAAMAATGSPTDADTVLIQLGCDIADGSLDGRGMGVDPRMSMAALAVATAVRLEVITGELYVDGQDATALLDDALRTLVPNSDQSVANVAPNTDLIAQAQAGLAILRSDSNPAITELAIALADATPATARGQVTPALTTNARNELTALPELLALSDDGYITDLAARQAQSLQASAPLVSLDASDVQVDEGQPVNLSWATSGAESCLAVGGWTGTRPLSGTFQTPALDSSTEFRLSCLGLGGVTTESVQVSVTPAVIEPPPGPDPVPDPDPTPDPVPVPGPDPAPVLAFSASQTTLNAGDSASLSWSASNSDSCVASGDWAGPRSVSGSQVVGPLNADAGFTLSCSGTGGTTSQSVNISVTQPLPLPTVNVNVAQASINSGDSTTLSWSATNADSCSANGGWSGNRATTGSESTGSLVADSTFNLTCSGPGGSASDSVSVFVTVTQPPVVTLSVVDSTINSGATTTLNWSTTNATTCTASGAWAGSRATSGTQSLSPTANAAYTLNCSGNGGTDTATVSVTVITPSPTLSFSSSDSMVNAGASVTLSWSSTGTTTCAASGGWSGARGSNGSELVGPINVGTTFTLTCSGAGGNIVNMLTVSTISAVTLNWQAPTENVDGSILTDLAGYRIYYGSNSRGYTDMVDVSDPTSTSGTLNLISGDYYVAMTALDVDGNESAYSNEVMKTAL